MILSEITLSYPCIKYNVKISHFTARKSTAIEWVILEAISKCSVLKNYESVPIAVFFEQIFKISDADLLIRPCLITLQDMGAISMFGIDDETELSVVPMSNLKLTKSGQEMQKQGVLPGTTAEDMVSIYYDLHSNTLQEGSSIYKEAFNGLKVQDLEDAEQIEFPMAAMRNWLAFRQKEKQRGQINWLTPTTKIEDISVLESTLLWKNISRKINLGPGLVWSVTEDDNVALDEKSLDGTNFNCPEEYVALDFTDIQDPDKEIENIIPLDEIHSTIKNDFMKDDLFCVDAGYYMEIPTDRLKQKKALRIGILYNAETFSVDKDSRQIIIRVPDNGPGKQCIYVNKESSIRIGKFAVHAGSKEKDIVFAYVPKNNHLKLTDYLVGLVDSYVETDHSLLFVLWELGLKDKFLEYVYRITINLQSIRDKSQVIEAINVSGFKYYNKKMITAMDTERLLINTSYIIEKSKTLEGAKEVLHEYGEINAFRQDENLFRRILKLVLDNVPSQNRITDIWELWEEIKSIKKIYLSAVNKEQLYKGIYSKDSIQQLIDRFDGDLFDIEEYTSAEQIILNMKRIAIRIQEFIPEINIDVSHSREKIFEVVLEHKESLADLYDAICQWRDEEDRFALKFIDLNEIKSEESSFDIIAENVKKLSDVLSVFFDDSAMRYGKVYIVDTCTLINEPELISWFDDDKALLIIPMVVLEELDHLKSDEDEEKAARARDVIRYIRNYQNSLWLNTKEVSHSELLPKDLAPDLNDNKILSISIKYIAKSPVLLTDDINLGNVAVANGIQTMDSNDYQRMKQSEKMRKRISRLTKRTRKKEVIRNEQIL